MQWSTRATWKFLTFAAIVLTTLLASCSSPSSPTTGQVSKAPDKQQVLAWPYEGISDIATLDPALATDAYSGAAIGLIYSGLVQYNSQGKLIPDLASSYSTSSDGLTWTFKLRDNAKWSDGTPVTSADVVYSYNRVLLPDTKAGFANFLAPIKDSDKLQAGKLKTLIGDSLLAPDPHTAIIKTSVPAAYFLDGLTFQEGYIVEKQAVEKYGKDFTQHLNQGGGSGAWIVSKFDHGKEIDFTPNPYYFGKKPQLRMIARPFFSTADTSYRSYQVNGLDFATVPKVKLDEAKALPDHQFHQDLALQISFFLMNYLVKPFDNIKIRQAFALALNKDEITQKIYKGTYIPSNHIIPQGANGYNPNLIGPAGVKGTAGDPKLARQLFDEGLKEEGLTRATLPPIVFSVTSGGAEDARNLFAVAQQMWQNNLGINVKIDDMDTNKLISSIVGSVGNSNVMAASIAWGGTPDPENWTNNQFGKGSGTNLPNYGQNSSSDAAQQLQTQQLIQKADANTTDQAQRMQQYDQAEQQLVNDVAWLPIFQVRNLYVLKPCVVNWSSLTYGTTPDDMAKMYITTQSPCANTSHYQ
ncbi:peptide ABC transporter substrate-binding protein [Ktedonosporobacter rubrisoli]|uniref:Peptide ABC transporter substrate-binding protein n=1 Tax=Ktedonosporobacter rubrisoli TaxID=2509675 RepID=A0A4P6K2G3_KTERU|nr:peptide ABC transporter substrate-binding protein [Ktedonosporobacter rubrisoli]QBD82043.1 peptide ABC transporter substrate-binding protein [Ktedonosporobacter rubrisoli]